ncbi:MAG TPA: nucleotidyltransferase substrate binding protein [Smithellaceae bacterium]|nr:nucleotidyltransferase substrate binding protein [Smithellaceae bacterium]HQM46790.1 nucleotidyltransferase substrate binding protein [Smithellaceae bacterium]
MPLELSSLQKAVRSLKRAIGVSRKVIASGADGDHQDVIRAGVIQNFEFTYELCWKFMKRWLEINGEGASIDGATRKELFRIAAEHRLIDHVEVWFAYAAARNETSHIYDSQKAVLVFETAKTFLKDAQLLLRRLKSKND